MGRIHRQIFRDVLSYAAIMALIVLLLLVVAKISQYLKEVSFGDLPFSAVMTLLWLGLPSLIATVLPIAVFFGVYLTFNRMYRQNEMTALAAAGVGLPRLLRPALLAMSVFLVWQLFTSLYWAPRAERDIADKSGRYARMASMAFLQPGAFNRLPGDRVIYLGRLLPAQTDRYQGVFVYEHGQAGSRGPVITTAQWGQIGVAGDGGMALILLNGHRYAGTPGKPGFQVLDFSRYYVHLPPPKLDSGGGGGTISSKSTEDLLAMLQGPDAQRAWSELEWRLGWPLMLPLLVFLAIPLAYTPPRGGRAGGILLGVLILLLFNNLLLLSRSWMDQGRLAPFPGIWWVHALLLSLGVYAFYRRSIGRVILPWRWSWIHGRT